MTDPERPDADRGIPPDESPGHPESAPAASANPPYPAVPYPGAVYPGGVYPGPVYPGPVYPGGAYPVTEVVVRPPSGGAAITAGVLAVLGAIAAILLAVYGIGEMASIGSDSDAADGIWMLWLLSLAAVLEVITLGWGSVLLFMRHPGGRRLVAAGCLAHILMVSIVASGIIAMASDDPADPSLTDEIIGLVTVGILMLIPAIVTLIVVLTPATGQWLRWSPQQPDLVGTGEAPVAISQSPQAYPGGAYPVPDFAFRPSGRGPAIAAAVLGLLGAAGALISGVGDFSLLALPYVHDIVSVAGVSWVYTMQGCLSVVELITLGVGSIMLLQHRPAGRWWVALGCVAFIVGASVATIALPADVHSALFAAQYRMGLSGYDHFGKGTFVMGACIGMIAPIITLILTLRPSTGRWLEWGQESAAAPGYRVPPNGISG